VKLLSGVLASLVLVSPLYFGAAPPPQTPFRGPYLGQDPPGTAPEVFIPGFFSSYSRVHGRLTFSPDGLELFWSANAAPVQKRWQMKEGEDGVWSEPEPSLLSLDYSENGLSFARGGERIYFHSSRASAEGGQSRDANVWYRDRAGGGWSDPIALGPPVNSPATGERQPTVAEDGALYFVREGHVDALAAEGRGRWGRSDIFVSLPVEGGMGNPVMLGPEVNSEYHELEPAVAPDHSYLVFTSNRPGGFSPRMNLYVVFREEDGSWSNAVSLSDAFELDNIWFPSISPDGHFLFFCDTHYTEDGIIGDYYWVDTQALEELRPH